jgi:hypothetical protein
MEQVSNESLLALDKLLDDGRRSLRSCRWFDVYSESARLRWGHVDPESPHRWRIRPEHALCYSHSVGIRPHRISAPATGSTRNSRGPECPVCLHGGHLLRAPNLTSYTRFRPYVLTPARRQTSISTMHARTERLVLSYARRSHGLRPFGV